MIVCFQPTHDGGRNNLYLRTLGRFNTEFPNPLCVSGVCYNFEIVATTVGSLWSSLNKKGAYIPEICRKRSNNIRPARKNTNVPKYIGWNNENEYLSGKLKNCSL
jgi:hypothetical protein